MPNWPTITSWPQGDPSIGFTANSVLSATKRFWHDGQDSATTPGGATMTDKFLNGYDVTQAVAGKQPTVVTDQFGGRRSIRFLSASSQTMVLTDSAKVTAFGGGTDVAYEWWLVLQLASVAGAPVICGLSSSALATIYSLNLTNGALWQYERRDGVGADTLRTQSGAIPAASTPYIMRCRYTGTDAAWTVNGVVLTTAGSSDTGAMVLDQLEYGAFRGTAFWGGWLGESIGYSGTLSASDASNLTLSLKAKWGIGF